MVFGRISNAMLWGFWSGAGRFVLNSLDDGLRTNPTTSAREFISFCKIANLPDLSVGALTVPTAFSEESTLKPSCLVRRSSVFITGLVPGGFDPSYLRFPAGFLYSRCSCVHLAGFFFFRFLSVGHGEPLFKWRCHVLLLPWLHVPVFWFAVGVASLSSVSHDGLSGAAPLV